MAKHDFLYAFERHKECCIDEKKHTQQVMIAQPQAKLPNSFIILKLYSNVDITQRSINV